MGWPPQVGELLPRAEEAIGVRQKLATYSLDTSHESGGPKAHGFERILGITHESITYLEREILTGVRIHPIGSTRVKWPFGIACVVEWPIGGVGHQRDRTAPIRTVWLLEGPSTPPRLTNAYLKP